MHVFDKYPGETLNFVERERKRKREKKREKERKKERKREREGGGYDVDRVTITSAPI